MSVDFFKQKNGYEIEGIWVPRVTAITSVIAKPALLKYYAGHENWAAAQESLGAAADWGQMTHEAVESILKNETPKIEEKIRPSIEAFEDWRLKHRVKIKNPAKDIETLVFDKENRYAGRMDVFANIDGKAGIMDLKTSTGIWDEYSLQTAAYMNAYNKKARRKAETRWILRIDQYQRCLSCPARKRNKDNRGKVLGGNPLCNHKWGESKGHVQFKELLNHNQDIKAFLSAKMVWEWYNKDILRRIENYPYAPSLL